MQRLMEVYTDAVREAGRLYRKDAPCHVMQAIVALKC